YAYQKQSRAIKALYPMKIDVQNFEVKAKENAKKYKHFLKKTKVANTLNLLPQLHTEAFEKIDCLQCANCCKNYSHRFKMPDIKRIAKRLKMKETKFIQQYLVLDTDGDYVVKTTPCPFLGQDNYCGIYQDRPRDCYR